MLPYCRKCKGYVKLCKLDNCPMLDSIKGRLSNLRIRTGDVSSLTPPGIFIGTYNYPKVFAGPLAVADTSSPYPSGKEYGRSIEEIIALNSNIYRASRTIKVDDVGSKYTISLQESTMSTNFVDMELNIWKQLETERDRTLESPITSMVELRGMQITSNPRIPGKVEYFHSDTDLKAEDAVWSLYSSGLEVGYLEGVLSSGALGTGRKRRLVPTKWAITAVDDIIYRNMKNILTDYPVIPDIKVFRNSYLGNSFTIILLPYSLAFEMQEKWKAGNDQSYLGSVSIDYEFLDGRRKYADNVGGAYYAARLAVFEHLMKIRRQAAAIVLRTIGSEYYAPLGVWVVRETVRNAFNETPYEFRSSEELVKGIEPGIRNWNVISQVLKNSYIQKSIFEFS